MEEHLVDSVARSDSSSVGAYQDSNNLNMDLQSFWLGVLYATHWLSDGCFSSELQDQKQAAQPSIRDDQMEDTERKLDLDKGSWRTVNSDSNHPEALSQALSATAAALGLSLSASSSSQKCNPGSPVKGIPMHNVLTSVESRERAQTLFCFPKKGCFQPNGLEKRNGNVLALDSNGNEMPIESTSDAGEELKNDNFSVPVDGMEFCSEEKAYNFYKRYAEGTGFKVRKGKVLRSSNGDIRKRYFFCSSEGHRLKKQSNKKTKYKRKETRTGCKAKMECMVKNGKWIVSQFYEEHNHVLRDQRNLETQTVSEAPR